MPLVDLTDTKEQSFAPLQAGMYFVECTNAIVKPTRAETGEYIEATLVVKTGTHEGRQLWVRFNIKNDSEKAQQIGKEQLKSFLVKSNFENPDALESSNELVGLQCVAKVTIKQSDHFNDTNEVRWFISVDEAKELVAKGQATEDEVPF